jgi:hypothetical protein
MNSTLAVSDDISYVTCTTEFPVGGPVIRTAPPCTWSGRPVDFCIRGIVIHKEKGKRSWRTQSPYPSVLQKYHGLINL